MIDPIRATFDKRLGILLARSVTRFLDETSPMRNAPMRPTIKFNPGINEVEAVWDTAEDMEACLSYTDNRGERITALDCQ